MSTSTAVVLELADIPSDVLEKVVMMACEKEEEEEEEEERKEEEEDAVSCTTYSSSGPDMFAGEDVYLPEEEVVDVDRYVEISRALLPSRADVLRSVVESLVHDNPDGTLPWIMSSAARTERWMAQALPRATDLRAFATGFERACETNNERALVRDA